MGNFISSRDYLLDYNSNQILCRNGVDPLSSPDCSFAGIVTDPYYVPFSDGPQFLDVFYKGALVRVDVGDRNYWYTSVINDTKKTDLVVLLKDPVTRGPNPGQQFWISPVAIVRYTIAADPNYISLYTGVADYDQRWILTRTVANAFGDKNADIIDFLLPQTDPQTPGLSIDLIMDANGQLSGQQVLPPNIQLSQPCNLIPGGNVACANPVQARAAVITLRARTETEDSDFTIFNYSVPGYQAGNIGIDLDVNPTNGLAHVRTERTVVEMKNLSQSF